MGADMQFNGYFPGFYTATKLSFDGNSSSYTLNCENKVLENGNLYNTAFISPDYPLSCNKEQLKQTMLKHETIFKDQIQELHRLYRRQRELMDEMRRNGFDNDLKSEPSHSNMTFFRVASEYVQKNFQVPVLINSVSHQMPVSGPAKVHSPSSLVQGNDTQARSKDIPLFESKCKKVGKQALDLQLPADEYIYCDGKDLDDEKVSQSSEGLSHSVNRSRQAVYTDDVKSFFGNNLLNSVFNAAAKTSPSVSQNLNSSADPNVACKLKEQSAFLSNGFFSPTCGGEFPENTKSTDQYLPQTGRNWEQQLYPDKTGIYGSNLESFVQGFNGDKFPSVSKLLHKDLAQALRPPTFQQGNQSLSIERTIYYGSESSRINSTPLNENIFRRLGALHGSIFNNHGPQIDQKKSESILNVREPRDSGRNPIAVQALPCFNTSASFGKTRKLSVGRAELAGDCNVGPENHGLKEHKASMNYPFSNYMNFEQPRCYSELAVTEHIQTTDRKDKRHDYSESGSSWLRKKPVHEKDGYAVRDVEQKKAEDTFSSCKTVPGLAEYNKSIVSAKHLSSSSYTSKTCHNPFNYGKRGKCTMLDLNMDCESVPESETEITADRVVENRIDIKGRDFGCIIDLNSSVNEADIPQKPSLTTEIGLDAPSSPENKECSPPRGESDENQQEDSDHHGELARIAAEVIVSFSSTGSDTYLQKETPSKDTLEWFAGIVSSVASDMAGEFQLFSTDTNNDDEMDYFEAMTLNLAETRIDEHCYKSNFPREEETETSSSPSQQRKGRARRGMQHRKDFLREILPSLATLSRYEVTKDLQTIGGLMEASGGQWETSRSGSLRPRRWKAVDGCSAESILKQLSGGYGTVGKEERSVICWGKVTRRRRGQRCPVRVSNQRLIQSQV